jgi:polyisoprenoid-binding protein YceI
MKSNLILISVICLFLSSIAHAENSVTFEGVGSPGFLTIEGKGGKVEGALELKDGKVFGKFEVDLRKFDSGIDLRNEHMRNKYLEVDKYPKAKLTLLPALMPKGGYFNWKGDLTIRGVTNKVGGVAFVEDKQIEAKFSINMSEFNIKKATYLGVGLDDKINIVVRLDSPG